MFNPFLADDPDNSTDSVPAGDVVNALFGGADANTSDEWSNAAASLFFAPEAEEGQEHEVGAWSSRCPIACPSLLCRFGSVR